MLAILHQKIKFGIIVFRETVPSLKSRLLFFSLSVGEDELTLTKGDVIDVLSKDYKISGDEGWWTGKCNAKVGVFPCNFVAPCDLDFSNLSSEELKRFYPPHISFSELEVEEVIGVGGFGKVQEEKSGKFENEALFMQFLLSNNDLCLFSVCLFFFKPLFLAQSLFWSGEEEIICIGFTCYFDQS